MLIPRGGAGLIRSVVENARVPVIETGAGVCHVYVEATAQPDMAARIIENAKCSRPSVCNAAETLLVDRAVAQDFLPHGRAGPVRATAACSGAARRPAPSCPPP